MAEFSFEEILEKISKNPDVIEKITSIAKNAGDNPYEHLSEIMSAIAPTINNENDEMKEEVAEKVNSAPKAAGLDIPIAKLGEKITKNSKLLLALKPYLSRERSDLIDMVIKMAQVTDLMKLVK